MLAVVAAHDEADRIAHTLSGLARAFPDADLWVADDGSRDDTAAIARRAGITVVGTGCRAGKGPAMTAAVRAALSASGAGPVVLLCDGDLGHSAARLGPLVDAIERGEADLAIAAFSTRDGGGLGLALAFARWAVRRRCGLSQRAPLSGQRALRADVLAEVLPFAPGYGMELGMTIDAARAGRRVIEVELALSHRPTGRGFAGFAHRARQMVDLVRVYVSRGRSSRSSADLSIGKKITYKIWKNNS